MCFAHLARAYLSLLASKGSDWLQMSAPLPRLRAVERSRPSLKRRRSFRLISRGRLTCQSMIQQINHHTLSHTVDVEGCCEIGTQTAIIKTFITAKSDIICALGQKMHCNLRSCFKQIYFCFYPFVYPENTVCSNTQCHQGGHSNVLLMLYFVTNNLNSKYKQMSPTDLNYQITFWILWIFLCISELLYFSSSILYQCLLYWRKSWCGSRNF